MHGNSLSLVNHFTNKILAGFHNLENDTVRILQMFDCMHRMLHIWMSLSTDPYSSLRS